MSYSFDFFIYFLGLVTLFFFVIILVVTSKYQYATNAQIMLTNMAVPVWAPTLLPIIFIFTLVFAFLVLIFSIIYILVLLATSI